MLRERLHRAVCARHPLCRLLDAGWARLTLQPTLVGVCSVHFHGEVLSRDVAQLLAMSRPGAAQAVHRLLSTREFEIFKLWSQGESLGEIAEQLGLTQKTVANHQSAIKQKLRVETPVQLVRLAMRLGWMDAGMPELLEQDR